MRPLPVLLLSLGLSLPLASSDTKVYICTGPKSECYHKTASCRGLKNCSGQIKHVTLAEAQALHRRKCKICY